MCHTLYWCIHLWARDLKKGDEQPAYTPVWGIHSLRYANVPILHSNFGMLECKNASGMHTQAHLNVEKVK